MKITPLNNSRVHLELSDREVKLIQNIFTEVKNILNYEAEFQTRVGSYYEDVQIFIRKLNNNQIISFLEVVIINNIMNEACNGLNIENFDVKIGSPKLEIKSYLQMINKTMNDLYSKI